MSLDQSSAARQTGPIGYAGHMTAAIGVVAILAVALLKILGILGRLPGCINQPIVAVGSGEVSATGAIGVTEVTTFQPARPPLRWSSEAKRWAIANGSL